MAEARSGPVGDTFVFTFVDDGGTTRTARVGLGTRTDQDFAATIAALRAAYPTIRQWAADAATANTNWPTMTAAQKDATTREVIRRLGIFFDRFGDLLVLLNGDQ